MVAFRVRDGASLPLGRHLPSSAGSKGTRACSVERFTLRGATPGRQGHSVVDANALVRSCRVHMALEIADVLPIALVEEESSPWPETFASLRTPDHQSGVRSRLAPDPAYPQARSRRLHR